MLSITDFRGNMPSGLALRQALPRAQMNVEDAAEKIRPVMRDVKEHGAAALRDLSEKFDGVRPEHLRVPHQQLSQALEQLDPEVREAVELSIEHNRAGHRAQLPTERVTEIMPGGVVKQRWIPVERVGLYVPGGLAVYPSSVVMNVVAAQEAGVSEIAVASPPQSRFGGGVHPTILAACQLLGVQEVYAVGGAQAIAMFAYGASGEEGLDPDPLCRPVDVITGPGNIFVAAAKRLVRTVCGIDAEAGPTEIGIIADNTADPVLVAADMISQAEHDPNAASVLFTDSEELAREVEKVIVPAVQATKHSQRICQALSGSQSGIVLVKDIAGAIEVANAYAPEHLEIHTAQASEVAEKIRNAGAIFVGPYSPVPLGDYLAGSNHVLPTGGTGRYEGGLSVMAYLKPVQQVEYQRGALEKMARPLTAFADAEDLPAHEEAVNCRFR
ncbi:histidinol dehydrogenase [Varibaculum vaginae]|uniref:histidinol dehydrogenase n=1 Tax=Varibaculum vaginae TaxID=2364797 RepID=UPI000F085B0A|nr:histidinol dehydrogenase [Varibaculum vaginae]